MSLFNKCANQILFLVCMPVLCLLNTGYMFGQSTVESTVSYAEHKKFMIGWNPIALLHKKVPGIELQTEFRPGRVLGIVADAGYFLPLHYKDDLVIDNFEGWSAGLGLRFHFLDEARSVYSAFGELRYKYRTYDGDVTGDFVHVDQYGEYYSQEVFHVSGLDQSIRLGFGNSFTIDAFRLDLIAGFIPTWIEVEYSDLPQSGSFDTNGVSFWEPDRDYDVRKDHLFYFEVVLGFVF